MTGYTYKIAARTTTHRVDVCGDCREKLGLPTHSRKDHVRVVEQQSSLFRDDPCLGCGDSASGGFGNLARPFDSEEGISDGFHDMVNADVSADALAQVLNMAENVDVFATVDTQTEEIPVAQTSDGTTVAKMSRAVEDAPKALHLMVMNDDGDSREEMEERCRQLSRLLKLNGWDGAPRPNPVDEEDTSPDWEVWAVPMDE